MSWERVYGRALVAIDLAAVACGVATAWLVLSAPITDEQWHGGSVAADALVATAVTGVWLIAIAFVGGYDTRTVGIGSDEYRRLGTGVVLTLTTAGFFAYALEVPVERTFLFGTVAVALVAALVLRRVARKQLHRQRAAGRFTHRVLVAGGEDAVTDLIRHFRRAPFAGYRVVAACVPERDEPLHVDGDQVPVHRDPRRITEALADARADTLAVADSTTFPGTALRTVAWTLEGTGVDLIVVPAVTEIAGPRIDIRPVAGLPLLHVEEPSLSGPARLAKAVVDRAFAALGLVVGAPLLVAIAIAVRATSPGPILFRQVRIGRDGRRFEMLKFRTMVADAEERLDDLRPLADPDHVLFKLREDPRVTRVGHWLRRHSLDELPQLWNVLVGDMSVVGPRPPLPAEVDRYGDDSRRRLLVKPGLTGLWQVSGRADLTWDDAVRLDLYYVENWSWVLDVLILVRTIPVVVKGTGAY